MIARLRKERLRNSGKCWFLMARLTVQVKQIKMQKCQQHANFNNQNEINVLEKIITINDSNLVCSKGKAFQTQECIYQFISSKQILFNDPSPLKQIREIAEIILAMFDNQDTNCNKIKFSIWISIDNILYYKKTNSISRYRETIQQFDQETLVQNLPYKQFIRLTFLKRQSLYLYFQNQDIYEILCFSYTICETFSFQSMEYIIGINIFQNLKSIKMNQFQQICSYKGHEQNKIKYVCLDPQCQIKRLICSQCLLDKFHKHDNENVHTYFDQKGLQAQIQSKIDKLKKQLAEDQKIKYALIQKSLKLVDGIFQQLDSILLSIKEFQQPSQQQYYIKSLEDQLNNIKQTKLRLIDHESVSQIVCKNYEQSIEQISSQIKQQSSLIIDNIKSINELWEKFTLDDIQIKIQNLRESNYQIVKLDQLTDNDIYTATISKDLKLIVSGGTDQILKIWNYQDYKFIKQYEFQGQVYITKFTDDSKLLYVGNSNGQLYCYDFENDMQEQFQKQIHNGGILNLYCITNYQVLSSSVDKTIVKTDILTKQQIFKINAHEDSIYGFDYHKLKDHIVTCSYDKSIKLWKNINGELIIEKKNALNCQIKSILFINNDYLISLSDKINIWQIKGKELISIKTITDKNSINNISLVLNQSVVQLICNNYVKFYTIQGELINTIKHDIKDFKLIRGVQLDSVKAIIIQGKKELKICRMEI